MLQIGDIFAVEGNGIAGWLSKNLITPQTDKFHFGLLWKNIGNNDFLILESITSKGLTIGKLSWYDSRDLDFYRVDCPEEERYAAPDRLLDYSRAMYDYFVIPKLLLNVVSLLPKLIKEHRKIRPEDLHYVWDNRLLCTEAVWIAYNSVGVNIIPYGVLPCPSAFEEARQKGIIFRVF